MYVVLYLTYTIHTAHKTHIHKTIQNTHTHKTHTYTYTHTYMHAYMHANMHAYSGHRYIDTKIRRCIDA